MVATVVLWQIFWPIVAEIGKGMYDIYFEIEQRIRKPKFDNIEGDVIFTPLVSEPRPTRG